MNIADMLRTSGRVWGFTLIGIAIAVYVWFFLPESEDRLMISGWAVTVGYLTGWLLSLLPSKKAE
ncbi:hypothetical protein [Methylophaga thiooxydans]|uniref:Uncharacterized protein n=1 Tax=Methylophaga thiooxydans DMS010 TaxID=637616 RepID=C0N9I1_9GAMM|nr:hypothetical protein [Methylophaga thiooxydans]EEF78527.1 hypothetical protein MDMS009_2700 [Methylophaga thiooxydans DMS010]